MDHIPAFYHSDQAVQIHCQNYKSIFLRFPQSFEPGHWNKFLGHFVFRRSFNHFCLTCPDISKPQYLESKFSDPLLQSPMPNQAA